MATWHQQQAQRRAYNAGKSVRLWHETLWTVVSDPPNDMTTVIRFDTKAEADRALAAYQAKGERHVYILPPANHSPQ